MKGKKIVTFLATAFFVLVNLTSPLLIQTTLADDTKPRTNGKQRIHADKLEWTPVSATNPLGGADDFNAILFDRFANFNETGGPVAAGTIDSVDIATFTEGTTPGINQFIDYVIPRFNVGLLVQNEIKNKEIRVENGDAVIGKNVDESKIGKAHPSIKDEGSVFKRQEQVSQFMAAAKSDLQALNKQLWNAETTGDAEKTGVDYTFVAKGGTNVFEIDGSTTAMNVSFTGVKADSTLIIKVKGSSLKLNSTFINGAQLWNTNPENIVNRIIWVFDPNQPTVTLTTTNLFGSALAAYTDMKLSGGYSAINGHIIAKSLDAADGARNSEFHYVGRFMGTLAVNEVEVKDYAVGDYVWVDLNKDGLQNSNEPVLSGVKVIIFDSNGKKLEETTTNKKGQYYFDQLEAGEYQLRFTLTKEQAKKYVFTEQTVGKNQAIDSDVDKEGWTTTFKLDENNSNITKEYSNQDVKATEGIDPTWDAGVFEKEEQDSGNLNDSENTTKPSVKKTYAIGNYVWIDANKNGIQDGNEKVLADVRVELFDITGKKLKTTKTDAKGLYLFDKLAAGNYQVKFTLTKEQAEKYQFTKRHAITSATKDSNANANGWTVVIALNNQNKYLTKNHTEQDVKATEGIDPTWDAGVVLKPGAQEETKDKTPDKKEPTTSNQSKTPGKKLPQTGEIDQTMNLQLTIIGLLLTASVLGIWVLKNKKQENN